MDSAFVILLSGAAAADGIKFAVNGVIAEKTIKLIAMIYFIMILENIMRTTGMIQAMVETLKQLVGNNRMAAALLPITIGLLPSPAGARFSCPMVDDVVNENSDNRNKAFINYWFRHIWADGFLLYPGVILAAELLEVPVISLFTRLLPFMVLRIILGAIFGLRHVKKEPIGHTRTRRENLKLFALSIFPALGVIILYILFLNFTSYALEISLLFMVCFLFTYKKYDFNKILKTVKKAFPLKFIIIILGVMVFKSVLEGSEVLETIPGLIESANIPVEALYVMLSYLCGFASGIAVSFVSIAFPVLIPLGLGMNMWHVVFAFCAGFAGVMSTPLHLCAVATSDYFKIPLGKLLSKAVIAESIFMAVIVLLFIIV
jgi:integral membrane protein (TIGR00529 family)